MDKKNIVCLLAVAITFCLAACDNQTTASENISTTAIEEISTENTIEETSVIASEEKIQNDSTENITEPETVASETEEKFDLDSYKEAATQCRNDIMQNQILLYNVAKSAYNYLSVYGTTSKTTVENAFEWLKKESGYTKDIVESNDKIINQEYKELILQEIEGKEAEEIDSNIRDMYTAYSSFYDTVMGMDGMTALQVGRKTDAATEAIKKANNALELFLGEFDSSLLDKAETIDSNIENVDDTSEESFENSENTETVEDENIEDSMPEVETMSYSAGLYKVGDDIPAGEYMVLASSSKGYFSVTADSNGQDIIFNRNFANNSIITLNEGEYVELKRCTAYPFVEWCANNTLDTTQTSFMAKIGVNLAAGEYKVEAETDKKGYWCIYANSRQEDIIANKNFEGTTYLSVEDGQYLIVNRAKIVE